MKIQTNHKGKKKKFTLNTQTQKHYLSSNTSPSPSSSGSLASPAMPPQPTGEGGTPRPRRGPAPPFSSSPLLVPLPGGLYKALLSGMRAQCGGEAACSLLALGDTDVAEWQAWDEAGVTQARVSQKKTGGVRRVKWRQT